MELSTVVDADPALARRMLTMYLAASGADRNLGVHSRHIDGTVWSLVLSWMN